MKALFARKQQLFNFKQKVQQKLIHTKDKTSITINIQQKCSHYPIENH
jgi:hypothetical protein